MTEKTPQEKGDALEHAVRAIETTILRSFPAYAEDTFRIESKKIVTVAGVRHEIDVFVSVVLGVGYNSTFIFECKNREEKVTKNDVIVFTEKIKVTDAQRGFFVAKSFTSDAIAQAEQDSRMELLTAVEFDPNDVAIPGGFHAVETGAATSRFDITPVEKKDDQTKSLDLETAPLILCGESMSLKGYVDTWVKELVNDRVNHFPSLAAPAGTNILEFHDERVFTEREALVAFVGESEMFAVERFELTGTVPVYVSRGSAISAFEVGSRGRVITVSAASPSVKSIVQFVQLAPPSSDS